MQVIVDKAEIAAHRASAAQLTCKRIILSTSNPMPTQFKDLYSLLNCIKPDLGSQQENMGVKNAALLPQISSMAHLQQASKLLSPLVVKRFQTDHHKVFERLNQVTLNV